MVLRWEFESTLSMRVIYARDLCACAFAASFIKRDRAIGDFHAECRPDGSIHQDDLAAVGAYEFLRDHEAEPGAAGPRRSLEGLEQMRPRLIGESRAGIRNLDDHNGSLAPPGDPDLIARRVVRGVGLQSLHGVAGEIDKDAQQLIAISIDD